MVNEMNTNNVVAMLKETANFCRDVKQIFEDICNEIGKENLITKKKATYESFFFDKEGWVSFDFYFEANNLINGFRLLVATESTEEYERYEQIINKLGIDKKIPLLFIYGCFEPVICTDQSTENIVFMMDACCGLTSADDTDYDWTNFNEKYITWNTDISVETKKWTPEVEISKDYPSWNKYFSKAKIKYKPLLELRNRADVESFANEIKAMTI